MVGGCRGGELQAAGSNAEGLSLLRDVQQLDLSAGEDEVTVKQLWGAPAPVPSAPNSTTPLTFSAQRWLRGLKDVWRGIS